MRVLKVQNGLAAAIKTFAAMAFLLAASLGPSRAFALPKSCALTLRVLDDPFPYKLENLSDDQIARMDADTLRLVEIREKLDWVFQGAKYRPEELIDAINKDDVRAEIFQVEALLRIFAESPKLTEVLQTLDLGHADAFEKALNKTLDAVTALENNIGWYTDAIQWWEWVRGIHAQYGNELVSQDLLDYYDANLKSARTRFKKFLKDAGWLGGKNSEPLRMFDASMRIINNMPGATARDLILNGIAGYLDDTDRRSFDMTDLNGGMHPFRRHLRWFDLMVQSSNLFALDSKINPIAEFKDVKLSPSTKRYAAVGALGREEGGRVHLSRSLVYEVIQSVATIGHAKDIGQFEESLTAALAAIHKGEKGFKKADAVKGAGILSSLVPDYVNPWSTALQEYQLVKRTGLLQELRREVLAGRLQNAPSH